MEVHVHVHDLPAMFVKNANQMARLVHTVGIVGQTTQDIFSALIHAVVSVLNKFSAPLSLNFAKKFEQVFHFVKKKRNITKQSNVFVYVAMGWFNP